jgi:hypothetical protein
MQNHAHHWLINSSLIGSCKLCGETKDFGYLQREVDPFLSRFHKDNPDILKGRSVIKTLGNASTRYNDNFPIRMSTNIYMHRNTTEYD